MPMFPSLAHRNTLKPYTVDRPQVHESMTRDQEDERLEGYMLREIGSSKLRSKRSAPEEEYLPGAPPVTQAVARQRSPNRLDTESDYA